MSQWNFQRTLLGISSIYENEESTNTNVGPTVEIVMKIIKNAEKNIFVKRGRKNVKKTVQLVLLRGGRMS